VLCPLHHYNVVPRYTFHVLIVALRFCHLERSRKVILQLPPDSYRVLAAAAGTVQLHDLLVIVSLLMTSQVHIDFNEMQSAFKIYVRKKAKDAGSNIIYVENGQLIKENPRTNTRTVLQIVTKHH
jgi:hypothetical protein